MTPTALRTALSILGLSDTQAAADWLGVSRRAVQRYVTTGPVPGPVHVAVIERQRGDLYFEIMTTRPRAAR